MFRPRSIKFLIPGIVLLEIVSEVLCFKDLLYVHLQEISIHLRYHGKWI